MIQPQRHPGACVRAWIKTRMQRLTAPTWTNQEQDNDRTRLNSSIGRWKYSARAGMVREPHTRMRLNEYQKDRKGGRDGEGSGSTNIPYRCAQACMNVRNQTKKCARKCKNRKQLGGTIKSPEAFTTLPFPSPLSP